MSGALQKCAPEKRANENCASSGIPLICQAVKLVGKSFNKCWSGFWKLHPFLLSTAVHSKSCHTCPALPYLRGRCKQLKGTSTNILFKRNFCVCVIRFTMMIQAWFMSEPLVTIWTSVWLFTSVQSSVHIQVTSWPKPFVTIRIF